MDIKTLQTLRKIHQKMRNMPTDEFLKWLDYFMDYAENKNSMEARQEVINFANTMEMVLKENDSKRNWKNCSRNYCEDRIIEEVGEYFALKSHSLIEDNIEKAQKELIDIANFCMFVWDKLEEEK